MKKASIILGIVSLIILGCSYFFMKKSSALISESEQTALDMQKMINSNSIEPSTKKIIPDNEGEYHYYYEDMKLKQADHVMINSCLQYYLNDGTFSNANKCEVQIVDAVVENMGEVDFIEAIFGSAISYKDEIQLKQTFPKMLFDTKTEEASLAAKLMLTYINRYRDPVKQEVAFDSYKQYFFELFSENLYGKLFEKQVNELIDTYELIQQEEDKEAFYKNIYYEAETKNRHGEFWNFTFWKRRALEKNNHVIYSILKEIKSYYKP